MRYDILPFQDIIIDTILFFLLNKNLQSYVNGLGALGPNFVFLFKKKKKKKKKSIIVLIVFYEW
jgi:hypothetical protein